MERYILSSAGVLLLGTLAAFLLFVPMLSIFSVALIILVLGLMFCLGFQVGRRRWPRIKHELNKHDFVKHDLPLHAGPLNARSR